MYRPDSVPFYLSQPSGMPEELTYREAVRSEKSPLTRAVPGYDTERAVFMLFEAALRKTHEEIYEAEDEGHAKEEDFQAMVTITGCQLLPFGHSRRGNGETYYFPLLPAPARGAHPPAD